MHSRPAQVQGVWDKTVTVSLTLTELLLVRGMLRAQARLSVFVGGGRRKLRFRSSLLQDCSKFAYMHVNNESRVEAYMQLNN